jgi:hypothetical protein
MGTVMETCARATKDGLATAATSVRSMSTARLAVGSALQLTRAMGGESALRMAPVSATLGGRENRVSGILQEHTDPILPVRGIKTAAELVTV